jgi:hypothetical protein
VPGRCWTCFVGRGALREYATRFAKLLFSGHDWGVQTRRLDGPRALIRVTADRAPNVGYLIGLLLEEGAWRIDEVR